MADEKKRIINETTDTALASSGDYVIVDSQTEGTRKFDLGAGLAAIDTALGTKVDKVTGKGLSTEDYTTAEKTKLSGIEAQANKTVLDTELATAGKAADAKATGDQISQLKEDLSQFENSIKIEETVRDLSTDWVQGNINADNGGTSVSSTACRNNCGLITSDTQTVLFTGTTRGYSFRLFFYSSSSYSTSTYVKSMTTPWINGANSGYRYDIPESCIGYYMKACVGWGGDTITPSDVTNVKIIKTVYTDVTLSQNGKAADAKITGDNLTSIVNTVGEVVTASFIKPTSGLAVVNFAYPVRAGRSIKFFWSGETIASNDSANVFSRETSSGSNVETLKLNISGNTIYEVTPTVDANYLRVVATNTGSISVYGKGTLIDDINSLKSDVAEIETDISEMPTVTPFVNFDFTYDMYDPSGIFGESGEMGSISGWNSKAEALTKVHEAFDALCTSGGVGYGYGERITGLYKINESDDALVDVLAPEYVTNGVTQGETVTLPIGTDTGGNLVTYNYTYESSTQPYEVRLYRFHDTNSALHKATVDIPKKKILLVGGVHGNEFCAPINLYVLAKHLCSDYTNPDVLKLRSSYDVYIVPYLNGFGCQYQWNNSGTLTTGTRCNGRMVDINRNCYTAGWSGATGTAEQITAHFENKIANLATDTFAGSSNGSEFESQLLKGLIEQIQPDVFIDHHHNSGNTPFYSTCRGGYAGNLIYQAANDTAYARIHNMPQYFGTKYNLFVGSDVSPATKSAMNGNTDTMAYELGVKMNTTCEMPESIAYLNGVVDSTTKTATKYSALAFKQAEYTLLNVALHLCQWAMEH